MAFQRGEKLHIIARRHFVGEVVDVGETTLRVSGYVFVLDKGRNEFVRRPDTRTRVFPLSDMGLIINVLPQDVDIAEVAYRRVREGIVVTDGKSFTMDINEFGPTR